MKPLHVIILALLAVGAGAIVWYSSHKESPSVTTVEQKLFPALAENLDAINQVMLSDAAGAKVTLERKDGNWLVKERANYFAKNARVAELVLTASRAKVIEQKTANPEFYERLGVRDIEAADSTAVLLSLASGAKKFDVLMGNSSERMGGSTFVRKPDSAASLLVSPALRGVTDADNWLDKTIADITAADVQSVKIDDAGKITEIRKQAIVGSEFDLAGRTEEQVLNAAAVRGLGQGLKGLTFERVAKGAAFAVNDYKRKTVTYTLFSGVVIDVTLFAREPAKPAKPAELAESDDRPPRPAQYWLNAIARFDEALAQQFVPQPTAGADGAEPQPLKLTAADLADRRAEVEQFNKTRQTWMYKITEARYKSMNQSDSSLIATP